jgi:hypothetical protein
MQVGDLVTLDAGYNVDELTGIVLKIDESDRHKVGTTVFPCFVLWSTGETDWMQKDFLRVINASG